MKDDICPYQYLSLISLIKNVVKTAHFQISLKPLVYPSEFKRKYVNKQTPVFTKSFACSFTGCVTLSGPIKEPLAIHLTWIAFESADVDGVGLASVRNVPFWTTGSQCIDIRTGNTVRKLETLRKAPVPSISSLSAINPKSMEKAEIKSGFYQTLRLQIEVLMKLQ